MTEPVPSAPTPATPSPATPAIEKKDPLRGYRGLTSGIPSPWSFQSKDIPQLRAEAGDDNPNE